MVSHNSPIAANPQKGAICILPRLVGIGGPASFRSRLVAGLEARGVTVVSDPEDPGCRALLVIGGTSRLWELRKAQKRGLRIVQRLNGMNWIHRRRFTGVHHFLRSEYNNFLLAFVRRRFADRIVYQSNFARTWWQTVYGRAAAENTVIYNGIDLQQFRPLDTLTPPQDHYRVLLVEGHLGGGNEDGLRNAANLAHLLDQKMDRPVRLTVAGRVPDSLRKSVDQKWPGLIDWAGIVQREKIADLDRTAHVLFSADLNAACPNSVIEALACGLPVVAYATGSLPELVDGDAGLVVPWGSNFWKLEPPDLDVLVDAAQQILRQQDSFRRAARARAEESFGLDTMVDRYINVLLGP